MRDGLFTVAGAIVCARPSASTRTVVMARWSRQPATSRGDCRDSVVRVAVGEPVPEPVQVPSDLRGDFDRSDPVNRSRPVSGDPLPDRVGVTSGQTKDGDLLS
jgi:hypothetical protein